MTRRAQWILDMATPAEVREKVMMTYAPSVHRRAHWLQERFPDAVLRDHQE